MRLVIHEWCCSGGLTGPEAEGVVGAGNDRESLVREGLAMFLAIVADAVRDGGFEVVALVDEGAACRVPAEARRVTVRPGGDVEALAEEAGSADAVIVVAPETAGVLAARVAAVRAAGGRPLAAGEGFLRAAADKQATIDRLAAAGVPVPAGRSLAGDEPWPRDFRLPAVRKPLDGTGCDGLVVVSEGPPPPPVARPTRLEAWCPGVPVGVSCLVGPGGVVPVAALRQRFQAGMRGYAGADPLEDARRRSRAELLAVRAIAALARLDPGPPAGWVGVDMILGPRDDGLHDRVLEVNARVTTSFVGLAAVAPASLVRAMVDVASGRVPAALPTSCTFSLADDGSFRAS